MESRTNDIKILFLEDNPDDVELMIDSLQEADFHIISEIATTKQQFLLLLDSFCPDIILADYSLPQFNGMHAFRLFKEKKMMIPFILVTGSLDEKTACECMDEGVDFFVLKSGYTRLPGVIKRGLSLKSAEKEEQRLNELLAESKQQLGQLGQSAQQVRIRNLLSKREYEILCLIASGKSIKEVALELFLSPSTIATYRSRILEKPDLHSNVDLTRYAIQNRLID